MRALNLALLILFGLAVLVFCWQNMNSVSMAFLGWEVRLPLPVLVILIYLLGMVSGWSLISLLRRAFHDVTHHPKP